MDYSGIAHLALAAVLACAALGKARDATALMVELRQLFASAPRASAWVLISLELLIASALIVPALSQGAAIAAGAFLVAATGYLALRLVVLADASCGCWGPSSKRRRKAEDDYGVPGAILRPLWYGVRNGLLLALAWAGLSDGADLVGVWTLMALPSVVLSAGLAGGILRQWRSRSEPNHPLIRLMAPQMRRLLAHSGYEWQFSAPGTAPSVDRRISFAGSLQETQDLGRD